MTHATQPPLASAIRRLAATQHRPTVPQQRVLVALAAADQTIAQLQAQAIHTGTRRALEQLVQRLAEYSWVGGVPGRAPTGHRQVIYWRLLPLGAAAAGLPLPRRTPGPPPQPRGANQLPTAAQREILELLTEFRSLTTAQIGPYLSANISLRALQLRLTGLRERGWLGDTRLQPERGARSQRAWTLLPAGGAALGLADPLPAPAPATTLRALLIPADPLPPLPEKGQAVLELLARWKALTTEQIARHLWDQWPLTGYLQAVLTDLSTRGFVREGDLTPEQGERSPHYWQLTVGGARQVGCHFDKQYRQRPTRTTITQRGVLLALSRQVAAAGWHLIPPHVARPSDPLREDSAQVQRLTVTVLDYLTRDLAARATAGESAQMLAEDRVQVQAGQIGAILPRFVNDWVAYLPDHPARTVLLIPHPPAAGLGFWANKPQAARRPDEAPRRESRLERYGRLAAILPVIAVFPDATTAAPYTTILAAGGFGWATVGEIAARLDRL
ncbi:MAG: hypothetical protein M3Z04_14055 [Chloroflexota bacterium]|nr:hypothetical protein [Chloroflexota bacterium]